MVPVWVWVWLGGCVCVRLPVPASAGAAPTRVCDFVRTDGGVGWGRWGGGQRPHRQSAGGSRLAPTCKASAHCGRCGQCRPCRGVCAKFALWCLSCARGPLVHLQGDQLRRSRHPAANRGGVLRKGAPCLPPRPRLLVLQAHARRRVAPARRVRACCSCAHYRAGPAARVRLCCRHDAALLCPSRHDRDNLPLPLLPDAGLPGEHWGGWGAVAGSVVVHATPPRRVLEARA